MKRNEFLKTSAILGGASLLPVNSVFSNSLAENGMDKLVDANGNFIHLALPYKQNFLEPYMDCNPPGKSDCLKGENS